MMKLKHHILQNIARKAVLLRWFYKQNQDMPEVCIRAFNTYIVSKTSSSTVTCTCRHILCPLLHFCLMAAEISSSKLKPSEQCFKEGSGLLQDYNEMSFALHYIFKIPGRDF